MLGKVQLKALIIAYHAVPGAIYDAAELAEMGATGQGNYLDTALGRILETEEIVDAAGSGQVSEPLVVDEHEGGVFIKGIGSEAKVLVADIPACNGVVHTVSHVLLPLDGDGELDDFQRERIAAIRQRSRALREERLADQVEREDEDDEYVEGPVAAPAPAPAARHLLQDTPMIVPDDPIVQTDDPDSPFSMPEVEEIPEEAVMTMEGMAPAPSPAVETTTDYVDAAEAPAAAPATVRRSRSLLDAHAEGTEPEWSEELGDAFETMGEELGDSFKKMGEELGGSFAKIGESAAAGEVADVMAPGPSPYARRRNLLDDDDDDREGADDDDLDFTGQMTDQMEDEDGADDEGMAPAPAPAQM